MTAAPHPPSPTGGYAVVPDADLWWWSPQAHALHGLRPGQVELRTALVAGLYDPDGWSRLWALLTGCARTGEPFATGVAVEDADGTRRWLAVTGEPVDDAVGGLPGVRGLLADVTAAHQRAVSAEATEQLERALASRSTIDQAKGALMLAYGVDAQGAFDLLRWCSQHGQAKLAVLAQRLVDALGSQDLRALGRTHLDDVLHGVLVAPVAPPHGAAAPPPPPAGLDTALEGSAAGGPGCVLRLRGEVDLATAGDFSAALAAAETAVSPPQRVVVDLTRVHYLGSVGVSVLTAAHRRCARAGTPLRVVLGRSTDVLDFPGLAHLPVFADVESARGRARSSARAVTGVPAPR